MISARYPRSAHAAGLYVASQPRPSAASCTALSSNHLNSPCRCRQDDSYLDCSEAVGAGVAGEMAAAGRAGSPFGGAAAGGAWGTNTNSGSSSEDEREASVGCKV